MAFGFVPLLTLGWVFEGSPFSFHWTTRAVFSLFYLALVGSCCAFMLYYWLVRRTEVTKTMLISLVTPVLAVTLGLWWLHEGVTWNIGFGALTIMAGIALNIWSSKKSLPAKTVVQEASL
jgi:drug/metabolite transporter (DMT)-like permease